MKPDLFVNPAFLFPFHPEAKAKVTILTFDPLQSRIALAQASKVEPVVTISSTIRICLFS
jgi:hypothetical protein